VTVVAVIPARKGSRGIPAKNLQKVGGKSLIQRTIEHAQESKHIDRILFTSDCQIMREIAHAYGTETIARPPELATDDAKGDDVILHALESIGCSRMESRDHLTVFLQPTSPLRPPGLIDECIERLQRDEKADCLFTVTRGHFTWRHVEDNAYTGEWKVVPVVGSIKSRKPRQAIPYEEMLFHENGCVYVTRTAALIRAKNRICGRIILKPIPPEDGIDIDTPYDLWLANARAIWLSGLVAPQYEVRDGEDGPKLVEVRA
jgi:N-acylneuraminate cytidylyltransferase